MSRRQLNPFVAALFGLLLVPGSMVLQAWNEYRTIHRTRGLNEAAEIVETIDDVQTVRDDLDKKLVHMTGEAKVEGVLRDPDFSVEAPAIHLRRVVMMYQWEEDEDRHDNHTTYSYREGWHEGRIDSDHFERRSGHQNPEPAFTPWEKLADNVTVGQYRLNKTLAKQKSDAKPVRFDLDQIKQSINPTHARRLVANGDELFYAASLDETPVSDATSPSINPQSTPQSEPNAVNAFGTTSTVESEDLANTALADTDVAQPDQSQPQPFASNINPKSPKIGDLRIHFEAVPQGPVSLIAGLQGNTFAAYQTSNGEPMERLYAGTLTAFQVVANLRSENSMMAWMLRGLGFVLCFVGVTMIFSPAQALFRWIPLVGDITGALIGLVAVGVALLCGLTTIAVSWVAVRPVFAIGLLAIAGGIAYLLRRKQKQVDHSHHMNHDEPIILTEDAIIS
ncbi:Protein of unknown function [Neorhodopirellula lusitana]|uniref:Transmembrane protein n=1 Tax=Neorhodopirellula lusitana TaxID=445327 RepID=A0ABY1QH27_9BACT|nr:TMEM43 family protein [Neorhodopirellula lusitana]SMP68273.1 Protein of unknown function [Neorhodopirellula lusitana]